MCMHWLKYVKLNRKDGLENLRGTKLEVAMLANANESHSAISSVYQCITGPSDMSLRHTLWIYWTLIGQ